MIGSQRIHGVVGIVSEAILLLGSLVAGADGIKPRVQNASACGAKGNGIEDDTAALQQALDTRSVADGGIVSLPAGKYLINGHLTIPENVTLEGIWRAPVNGRSFDSGSVLLATEGRGDAVPDWGVESAAHHRFATRSQAQVYCHWSSRYGQRKRPR